MTRSLPEIIHDIKYKNGWSFLIAGDLRYIQVQLPEADGTIWRGRKWLISPHMTDGEVVQTCLLAVLQAEEHEAREAFTYKGKAIFGPHLSIDRLIEIADQTEYRSAVIAAAV